MIRFLVSSCLVLLCATAALAQAPPPIKLTLSPAKAPTPALRYQLLPDGRQSVSGNAATFYIQVVELLEKKNHDRNDALLSGWTELSLEALPKDEVRKALAHYKDVFELLDLAARCDRCDWGLLAR